MDFLLQKLLVFIAQPRHGFGQIKLNNQPLAGIAGGILGPVQYIGRQTQNIEGLQLVGLAFQKMGGMGAEHHIQLIKGVEVLELHVDVRASHIGAWQRT